MISEPFPNFDSDHFTVPVFQSRHLSSCFAAGNIIHAVNVTLPENRAIDVRAQIFILPEDRGLALADVHKRAAVIVAGGNKHLAAGNHRVGGIDVVLGFPRKTPDGFAGGGLERLHVFPPLRSRPTVRRRN